MRTKRSARLSSEGLRLSSVDLRLSSEDAGLGVAFIRQAPISCAFLKILNIEDELQLMPCYLIHRNNILLLHLLS